MKQRIQIKYKQQQIKMGVLITLEIVWLKLHAVKFIIFVNYAMMKNIKVPNHQIAKLKECSLVRSKK